MLQSALFRNTIPDKNAPSILFRIRLLIVTYLAPLRRMMPGLLGSSILYCNVAPLPLIVIVFNEDMPSINPILICSLYGVLPGVTSKIIGPPIPHFIASIASVND